MAERRWRVARLTSTGEYLPGRLGSEGPFRIPAAQHAACWAASEAVPVGDVEVLEGVEGVDMEPDLRQARPPRPVPPHPDDVKRAAREAARRDLAGLDVEQVDKNPEALKRALRALRALAEE